MHKTNSPSSQGNASPSPADAQKNQDEKTIYGLLIVSAAFLLFPLPPATIVISSLTLLIGGVNDYRSKNKSSEEQATSIEKNEASPSISLKGLLVLSSLVLTITAAFVTPAIIPLCIGLAVYFASGVDLLNSIFGKSSPETEATRSIDLSETSEVTLS